MSETAIQKLIREQTKKLKEEWKDRRPDAIGALGDFNFKIRVAIRRQLGFQPSDEALKKIISDFIDELIDERKKVESEGEEKDEKPKKKKKKRKKKKPKPKKKKPRLPTAQEQESKDVIMKERDDEGEEFIPEDEDEDEGEGEEGEGEGEIELIKKPKRKRRIPLKVRDDIMRLMRDMIETQYHKKFNEKIELDGIQTDAANKLTLSIINDLNLNIEIFPQLQPHIPIFIDDLYKRGNLTDDQLMNYFKEQMKWFIKEAKIKGIKDERTNELLEILKEKLSALMGGDYRKKTKKKKEKIILQYNPFESDLEGLKNEIFKVLFLEEEEKEEELEELEKGEKLDDLNRILDDIIFIYTKLDSVNSRYKEKN